MKNTFRLKNLKWGILLRSESENILATKNFEVEGIQIAIVQSSFNHAITGALSQSVKQSFLALGGSENQIDHFTVPGALELPLAAQKAALTGRYHAVICLGAVIKGETSHFDFVCSTTIEALNQVSLKTQCPILCGVLTTQTLEQAQKRTHQGKDYLLGALQMIETLKNISKPG